MIRRPVVHGSIDGLQLASIKTIAQSRTGSDPAHDWLHVLRVAERAQLIAQAEGADVWISTAAALLHEVFTLPKGHPESHLAGVRCSEVARGLLLQAGVDMARSDAVAECIRTHAFSYGAAPESIEAAILQDADRLDAIGAIGIARCFATCASMQRPFYSGHDPFCEHRMPDDSRFGIDHFFTKLLRIEERLHTNTARLIARNRVEFLRLFVNQLREEILPSEGIGR